MNKEFEIVATIWFGVFAIIWSQKSWLDQALKVGLSVMTLWGGIIWAKEFLAK